MRDWGQHPPERGCQQTERETQYLEHIENALCGTEFALQEILHAGELIPGAGWVPRLHEAISRLRGTLMDVQAAASRPSLCLVPLTEAPDPHREFDSSAVPAGGPLSDCREAG